MRALHSNNGVRSDRHASLVYVSVGEADADVFSDSCRGLGWIDAAIDTVCGTSESLDRDEERFLDLLAGVREADMLFIRIHGDRSRFIKFDRLMDMAVSRNIPVLLVSTTDMETEDFRRLFTFSDDEYDIGTRFLHIGGAKNYTALHIWACSLLNGMELHIPEPDIPPAQGIYHRGKGPSPKDKEYLERIDRSKPVVGIVMSQRSAIEEECCATDALIDALKSKGAEVIPIFLKSAPGKIDRSIGVKECFRKYFMKNRKPLVDVVVVCTGFSQRVLGSGCGVENPFDVLGVPVIQAPSVYRSVEDWTHDVSGLDPMEISVNVTQTEFDGQILSAPLNYISRTGNRCSCSYVQDRVERIADDALAWCRLRRLDRKDVRVAIILNRSSDSCEPARGLDSVESLRMILKAMLRRGYDVPAIPEDRLKLWTILSKSNSDGLVDLEKPYLKPRGISSEHYSVWLRELPRFVRERMLADFGKVGHDDVISIPGFIDGKVFIGIEPDVLLGYHHVFSHQFFAFYRWIKDTFRADAIIHLGDHSMLDGLPGKEVGLSSECLPDIVLGSAIRICPFAMDDLGNGLVAKRRAHSVLIGHLIPPVMKLGLFGEMEELEARLQTLMSGTHSSANSIASIRTLLDSLDLWSEVDVNPEVSDAEFVECASRIYDYISGLKNESTPDGLHVFGETLRGDSLRKSIMCCVRNPNGDIPSIFEALSRSHGADSKGVGIKSPGSDESSFDSLELEAEHIIELMSKVGFDREICRTFSEMSGDMMMVSDFICDIVVPSLKACNGEMDALMNALEGRFVAPGPSGSPYGGDIQTLPSGRNLHASNLDRIPSEVGWERGSQMAEEIVSRFIESEGRYPERIAVMVGGGSTLSNGGSDIACAMKLVGLRPVWNNYGGALAGMEPISLSELGRPRVDVRFSMAPFITNALSDVIGMFEAGLRSIAAIDEGLESENLRRSIRNRLVDDIAGSMDRHDVRGELDHFDAVVIDHIEGTGDTLRLLRSLDTHPGRLFCGDSGDLSVYGAVARLVRTRITNPKWVDGLMPYGPEGARSVAGLVSKILEWSRVDGATQSWMFESVYRSLVSDEKRMGWLVDSDPSSACNVLECLMEAAASGKWKTDTETEHSLRDLFLECDGVMEDTTSRGHTWVTSSTVSSTPPFRYRRSRFA